MWTLIIAMLVILVLAGLVVVYVAFPHRGEDVPAAPWIGDVMKKGVEAAPTLDNTADGDAGAAGEHADR
jgi:flagellar basal body-associated protein FliL